MAKRNVEGFSIGLHRTKLLILKLNCNKCDIQDINTLRFLSKETFNEKEQHLKIHIHLKTTHLQKTKEPNRIHILCLTEPTMLY